MSDKERRFERPFRKVLSLRSERCSHIGEVEYGRLIDRCYTQKMDCGHVTHHIHYEPWRGAGLLEPCFQCPVMLGPIPNRCTQCGRLINLATQHCLPDYCGCRGWD